MRSNRTLLLLPLLLATATDVGAQTETADIKEWPVEWGGRPRDPYMDGQNRVWFVGQRGNYIAYFEPKTETFKRYEIEEGTNPHNLIVDAQGVVWYAGNGNGRIGRLDPATGEIKTFMMPDPAAGDPHTLTFDSKGDIWFTVQGGGFVGKLTTATGEVKLIPTGERTRPYGIRVGPDDHPWIVLFNTNKLATVDPATMQLRTVDLPRAEARPRRLEVTGDGMVWYVDYAGGYLGRYDPRTKEFEEFAAPSAAESRPYATEMDAQGRIWFVETGVRPNQLVGFDPKTEKFFSVTPIPSGGGAVRHMMYHEPTNTIWFGTDTENIGRAILPK